MILSDKTLLSAINYPVYKCYLNKKPVVTLWAAFRTLKEEKIVKLLTYYIKYDILCCYQLKIKYKREHLSISQKTACLMAGGFLTAHVCVHVPAHTGTWLL